MNFQQIAEAADVISEAYQETQRLRSALELAELRNRWYNARLIELLNCPDLNLDELEPATIEAVKNAHNLLEGLARA